MTQAALSPEDTAFLIQYACRKFREERFPFSPELRPVREAIGKLEPRPAPIPPPKPYVPSLAAQKRKRRR